MSKPQTPESFWLRVNKQNPDTCWEWQGSVNNTGYGTVAWHGHVHTAHRIAAWLSGLVESPKAPESKRAKTHVLHSCDNRKCCNPAHFFLGNYTDNQKDAYNKRRRAQPKGSKHVNAALSESQVICIRSSYTEGATQNQLAVLYSVSQSCISKIVRGETYKWT